MNLKKIFEPETLCVIGVSTSNPFHPANVIFSKNKLRYKNRAYCVNPNGGDIYGDRIYRSIAEVPEKIDVAVLAVRSDMAPGALEELIAAGASGAIIISGGFAETGNLSLQEQLIAIAAENSFPVVGPNCLGIYSPPRIDTFFLPSERLVEPIPGRVSLISQSGGILVDQLIKMTQEGVGIARAVSIGNKAVIDEIDMLRYFKSDKNTGVIGLYVEGFHPGRGREFINEVNSTDKPVVVIKSGKTPGGTRAVSSHTASMAGDYFVFSEVLRESKALEARSEAEFVSCCEALSCYRKSGIQNICIITASGGHGAMASDGCYSAGLTIVDIPDEDKKELREHLSRSVMNIASVDNPIDLTGSANDNDFLNAFKVMAEKDYVDAVILLMLPYLPGITSDIGARMAQAAREHGKPVVCYLPHVDKYGMFIEGFESNGIPVAHSVEGAVNMTKVLARKNP
ncbi:MAG TPA: CoA-binding protein [Spirochaetes bacterium]|nr:CoA-binding protein [Spirochaetota bacterium]